MLLLEIIFIGNILTCVTYFIVEQCNNTKVMLTIRKIDMFKLQLFKNNQ